MLIALESSNLTFFPAMLPKTRPAAEEVVTSSPRRRDIDLLGGRRGLLPLANLLSLGIRAHATIIGALELPVTLVEVGKGLVSLTEGACLRHLSLDVR